MLHLRLQLKNAHYEDYLEEWAERLNVSVEVVLARIVEAMAEGSTYCEKSPDWIVSPECRKRQRPNRKGHLRCCNVCGSAPRRASPRQEGIGDARHF